MGKGKEHRLERTTLVTSRLLDFCSEKELVAQTGHFRDEWPLVILKELVDNALDACEDARVAPEIKVAVDEHSVEVSDNGPGIAADTINKILDFSVRVSSREAYVAPDRGAQGNALKTVIAMPFVLHGERGQVSVATNDKQHQLVMGLDALRQRPVLEHYVTDADPVRPGTRVRVAWPESACSLLRDAEERFLQVADDYTLLNPHVRLHLEWFGESREEVEPTDPSWVKWRPSDPTSAHWYDVPHLSRLIAGYIAHDQDNGGDRTVREFISEFRGLSGTRKQKAILNATDLARVNLSALGSNGRGVDTKVVGALLECMKQCSRPPKPGALGIIGKGHLARRFEALGCEMESFDYRKVQGEDDEGLPFVIETAFGWCEGLEWRRMVTGVNWSPGIVNPFRQLGRFGQSLDSILEQQRVGQDEPVAFLLHCAHPRVEYTDRGKSAVVVKA